MVNIKHHPIHFLEPPHPKSLSKARMKALSFCHIQCNYGVQQIKRSFSL